MSLKMFTINHLYAADQCGGCEMVTICKIFEQLLSMTLEENVHRE